eukprot:4253713-Amphidinium_carterae.1
MERKSCFAPEKADLLQKNQNLAMAAAMFATNRLQRRFRRFSVPVLVLNNFADAGGGQRLWAMDTCWCNRDCW